MVISKFISFKSRSIDPSAPASVYRNLHKHCYSIIQKGVVVGHCETVMMCHAEFRVRQSGREKVIKDKRKNVHAYIRGFIALVAPISASSFSTQCKYNPYTHKYFEVNHKPIQKAGLVLLNESMVLVSGELVFKET